MKVNGVPEFTIKHHPEKPGVLLIIDQRWLPSQVVWEEISNVQQMIAAIKDMHLRGAPLIGVAGAYGAWLAVREWQAKQETKQQLEAAFQKIAAARPTAVNLQWAVQQISASVLHMNQTDEMEKTALRLADKIRENDINQCRRIGEQGLTLIESLYEKLNRPLNILTHCNAGWLACVDYGTATAPIYAAHRKGIPLHVWADETRPRNQGARLTAWELGQEGVAHTVIPDNAGGHLMQHGKVDMVIVGADRVTVTGDAANKIGTYLKALAARDNGVPFYVAFPSSTVDWNIRDGLRDIPIEERSGDEVALVEGFTESGSLSQVRITPVNSVVANPGFDVTPRHLISGLITERGVCKPDERELYRLFPENAP